MVVAANRNFSQSSILDTQNHVARNKWIRAGLNPALYDADPQAAQKVVALHLHHSSMTWNMLRIEPQFHFLQILVDDRWQEANFFLRDIETDRNEWKSISNPERKWCCTSRGLIPRHSADWQRLPIAAQLSLQQLQRVQTIARRCISPLANSQNPDHVIEICVAKKKVTRNFLLNGIDDLIKAPQHPWIRIIDSAGRVRIAGFCAKDKLSFRRLFQCIKGEFRSPDTFETYPVDKKYITRIAVTGRQCTDLIQEIEQFQVQSKKLHYWHHNCSTFTQHVLRKMGFKVQARMAVPTILYRCLPLGIQKCTDGIAHLVEKVYRITWVLPRFFEGIAAFFSGCANRISRLLFGNNNQDCRYFPGADRARFYHFIMPRKILSWQEKQSSTLLVPQRTPFMQQYDL